MKVLNKLLVLSLAVVWISVFVKYESFAFLSRSSSNSNSNRHTSGGERRIRQSIRNIVHSRAKSQSNSNDQKSRIRSAIREKINHAKDKIPFRRSDKINGATTKNSRIKSAVREKIHSVKDKFTKSTKGYPTNPTQRQPHVNPNPNQPAVYPNQPHVSPNQPFVNPNQPYNPNQGFVNQPYPTTKKGFKQKIKDGAKALLMAGLAKKIMGKGKHGTGYHDYNSGYYNGYNYRPQQYGGIKGALCTNTMNYDGISFGQFYCPLEGYGYDETACCGPMNQQHCCTPYEAQNERNRFGNNQYGNGQYGNNQYGNNQYGNGQYGYNQYGNRQYGNNPYQKSSTGTGTIIFVTVVIMLLIGVCCALVFLNFFKKKYSEVSKE